MSADTKMKEEKVTPTTAQLRAETRSLPPGWVVAWSERAMRRYWFRAQQSDASGDKEITQWHAPGSKEEAKEKAEAEEKEKEGDRVAAEEAAAATNKKRRAGLGFGADDEQQQPKQARVQQQQQQQQQQAAPVMRFVSAGGAAANTPAATAAASAAAAASSSSASAWSSVSSLEILPSDPKRIESASRPFSNVSNPPVFVSSLAAVAALTEHGGFKKSEWRSHTNTAPIRDRRRSFRRREANRIAIAADS
jgi:hypothetical protein